MSDNIIEKFVAVIALALCFALVTSLVSIPTQTQQQAGS
jgi:hypothetical protein